MELDIIYNQDCLEGMKEIPDASIDLIVTDPPYKIIAGGVTIEEKKNEVSGIFQKRFVSDGSSCSNKWLKKGANDIPCAVRKGKMFEHNEIRFADWLPSVFRILKEGSHCYIMSNARNLKELQVEAEKAGFKFVNLLAWKKNNMTPNKYYMQQMEFILLLRKGRERSINNMGSSNCIEIPNIIGSKKHPTEKPIELMNVFIANSSDEGQIIFDPFLGSGTTAVAAFGLKRHYIGFEIDDAYFDIACSRLDEAERERERENANNNLHYLDNNNKGGETV